MKVHYIGEQLSLGGIVDTGCLHFFFFRATPVAYTWSNRSYSCRPTPQPQQCRILNPTEQGQRSNLHPHGYQSGSSLLSHDRNSLLCVCVCVCVYFLFFYSKTRCAIFFKVETKKGNSKGKRKRDKHSPYPHPRPHPGWDSAEPGDKNQVLTEEPM